MTAPIPSRAILFGAFDRHNFGDLLLAHCAAALRPDRELVFAGLAARDLTGFGGHRVRPLAEVVAAHGDEKAEFIHVGGELLTTTAWEAAVMLQTPEAAIRAIAKHDRHPRARAEWAATTLGTARHMPYVVDAGHLPSGWTVRFHAVGGTGFQRLAAADRAEVLDALGRARTVTVRDAATRAALARAGLSVGLIRDPAAATADLFGPVIAHRGAQGEVAALARAMPRWVAAQLAAHWSDDATLDRFAALLRRHARRLDAGIALFRAGLAPWHDDGESLARLAARLPDRPVAVFDSAHVLDICALLRGACGYLGTSLHGWIVAHAFGVAGRCLVEAATDKAAAYVDTWHPPGRYWRTLRREP